MPTTIGSFFVDPLIAPTMEPPPVAAIVMVREHNFGSLIARSHNQHVTCPLLSIGQVGNSITVSSYKKTPWIFSYTKGSIPDHHTQTHTKKTSALVLSDYNHDHTTKYRKLLTAVYSNLCIYQTRPPQPQPTIPKNSLEIQKKPAWFRSQYDN